MVIYSVCKESVHQYPMRTMQFSGLKTIPQLELVQQVKREEVKDKWTNKLSIDNISKDKDYKISGIVK